MLLLRRALFFAVRRLAANPRVQRKAADVIEHEIKPRAQTAWRQVEPKLRAAKDEVKAAARAVDARKDPIAFAAEAAKRLRRRRKD